jgi:hypothetical protein
MTEDLGAALHGEHAAVVSATLGALRAPTRSAARRSSRHRVMEIVRRKGFPPASWCRRAYIRCSPASSGARVVSPDDLDDHLATLPSFASMKESTRLRLARAIERGEKIVIVADYDADGATG